MGLDADAYLKYGILLGGFEEEMPWENIYEDPDSADSPHEVWLRQLYGFEGGDWKIGWDFDKTIPVEIAYAASYEDPVFVVVPRENYPKEEGYRAFFGDVVSINNFLVKQEWITVLNDFKKRAGIDKPHSWLLWATLSR